MSLLSGALREIAQKAQSGDRLRALAIEYAAAREEQTAAGVARPLDCAREVRAAAQRRAAEEALLTEGRRLAREAEVAPVNRDLAAIDPTARAFVEDGIVRPNEPSAVELACRRLCEEDVWP